MGRALADGWLRAGIDPDAIVIVDPKLDSDQFSQIGPGNIKASFDLLGADFGPSAVILAVKPQVVNDILPKLAVLVDQETLVVSVAAGVTLRQLQNGIGALTANVRAMPNMPAAVGAGITGLTAASKVNDAKKQQAENLLSVLGKTAWVENESLMNGVTALSGSGPAYVFHLVEAMASAGVQEGLDEDVAMQLARQTLIGAALLLEHEPDVPVSEMRRRITSPGGTTAAALEVLMHSEDGLTPLMKKAIAAAKRRGEELAG